MALELQMEEGGKLQEGVGEVRGNGRRGPGERVRKGGRESVIEEMGDEMKTEEEPVHDRREGWGQGEVWVRGKSTRRG